MRLLSTIQSFLLVLALIPVAAQAQGNGEAPPLNILDTLCAEGDTGTNSCEIRLQLQWPSDVAIAGNYTVYGDGEWPATMGIDFLDIDDSPGEVDPRREKVVTRNGDWQIAAGETETFLRIRVLGDTHVEADETLRLVLFTGNTQLGRRSQTSAMLTIMDDERGGPGLWAGDASVLEPDAGEQAVMRFEVRLSPASNEEVRVAWTTTANAEAAAGADFVGDSGVLVFPPGQTRRSVDVSILGDDDTEVDEGFGLQLGLPVGAVIARPLGIGVIRNDEPAPGRLRLLHSTSIAAAENKDEVGILLERIDGDSGEVSVAFATVDGSALGYLDVNDRHRSAGARQKGVPGFDYEISSGEVTWPDGQSHVEDITLNILDDSVIEDNEDFYLVIDAPGGGATLGDPNQVRIDIIDDDLVIFETGFEGSSIVID